MTINRWDYKILNKFNDVFYRDLLQKKHLSDSEKFIKTVNTPDDEVNKEEELNDFFFVLNKAGKKFLLKSDSVNELPIFVTKSERVGYKGEGYSLITSFKTARFKPENKYTFRQLTDLFSEIKHGNTQDFTLYKIIVLTAYFDRINVRVSTQPSFGKDSAVDLLGDLVGNTAIIQKPTIAKLEYLSLNKLLIVNELMNLSSQEYRDIEQYLLAVGAFKNNYTKRSRAGSESKEEYDISKLSVFLCFNDIDCYPNGQDEYFDKVQTKQVKDRFLPLRFKGTIEEVFPDVPNPEVIAEENRQFFIDIAKSIKYYENNWRQELKPYSELNLGLTGRWKRNFDTIARFINLYSKDEEEYKSLLMNLYKSHLDYLEMVSEGTKQKRFELDNYHDNIVEEEIVEDKPAEVYEAGDLRGYNEKNTR